MQKFIIKGTPVPLCRPRMGRTTVYDSQKHEKLIWGIELDRQRTDAPLLTGSLTLVVDFYFQPAKTTGKAKREKMHNTPHFQRPDLDNLIKWVSDVCNGIIYADDAIISRIIAAKWWDFDNPRTEFSIYSER